MVARAAGSARGQAPHDLALQRRGSRDGHLSAGTQGAADGWACAACGKTATQVTRLFCATCLEHHEVCFDCAPEVEIDGRPMAIREALNLIGAQLGVDASRERLLIASTGEIALPHEPAQ